MTCDGNPIVANHVILEHHDGTTSRYWHLMTNSAAVEVGDIVSCGDVLGLIGSSGNSSFPHLHFQVELSDGTVIDPFAGEYSQEESMWIEQVSDYGWPGQNCAE